MNIFILHEDPVIAAQMHCDQHLQKMILESAQMLSTALHHLATTNNHTVDLSSIYKPAYQGHPCTQWCHQSYQNFIWVIDLVYSLQSQLPKIHKAYQVVRACELIGRGMKDLFPSKELTEFALAMPDEIKYNHTNFPDTVSKYHEWYKYKAQEWKIAGRFMTYDQYCHRPIPEFIRPLLSKLRKDI